MLSALLLALPFPGNVYVVDSTGAGDFVQLAEAVDFAADGDTIVVRPWASGGTGRYDAATIQDKDLRILGEWGTEPEVASLTVVDLAPDREVVIAGLRLPYGGVLAASSCSGSLRITGFIGGCVLEGCLDTVFSDCFLREGIGAVGSQLAVYDSFLRGKYGPHSGPAGDALLVDASVAWIAGVTAEGGKGRDDCTDTGNCNDGGDGIDVRNGGVVWATDCTFWGGEPGYCGPALGCEHVSGEAGKDENVDATSTLTHRVEPRRSLAPAPVTTSGGRVVLEAVGVPGERVFLIRSQRTSWRLSVDQGGIDHTWVPPGAGSTGDRRGWQARRDVGVIPDDGSLWIEVEGPALYENFQAFFEGPEGEVQLGDLLGLSAAPADTITTCPARLFIDADALPGGDGRSWTSAYKSLNEAFAAIAAARAKCPRAAIELWLAEGTYTPAPPGGSRSARFSAQGPVLLLGGFAGNESTRDERDPIAHPTILSGDLDGDDAPDWGNVDENSYTLLELSQSTYDEAGILKPIWSHVDGVTLQSTYMEWNDLRPSVDLEATILSNCTIRRHLRLMLGVPLSVSEGYMLGCTVEGNRAPFGGASGTVREVLGCRFIGNTATGASSVGGLHGSVRKLIGCVFSGNVGSRTAGAEIYQWHEERLLDVSRSTFYANRSGGAGPTAGLWVHGSGIDRAAIIGNVLWGNEVAGSADEFAQVWWDSNVRARFEYACVQGLDQLAGPGCHGLDPLFVDPLGADGIPGTLDDDLRLAPGSPCIDAGHNGYGGEDLLDFDGDRDRGEPLPFDVGGSARRVDDPGVPDTGKGDAPLVDMGAYEGGG